MGRARSGGARLRIHGDAHHRISRRPHLCGPVHRDPRSHPAGCLPEQRPVLERLPGHRDLQRALRPRLPLRRGADLLRLRHARPDSLRPHGEEDAARSPGGRPRRRRNQLRLHQRELYVHEVHGRHVGDPRGALHPFGQLHRRGRRGLRLGEGPRRHPAAARPEGHPEGGRHLGVRHQRPVQAEIIDRPRGMGRRGPADGRRAGVQQSPRHLLPVFLREAGEGIRVRRHLRAGIHEPGLERDGPGPLLLLSELLRREAPERILGLQPHRLHDLPLL